MGISVEDYRVVVNYMTYKGDQEILEYSLRSVLKVFGNNPLEIYIMDDDNNPMDESYVKKYTGMADFIHYEKTTFERNKNLNGRECVIGMLEKFIEHAGDKEALNMKIDPDTIVCGKRVFDEVYNAPNADYAATTRPGCHFSGILYCFRTHPLKEALRLIKEFPVPTDRGPEDYIIGLALSAASLPRLSLMIGVWNDRSREREGVSCAWNYGIKKEDYNRMIPFYCSIFQIVTMGNWFIHEGLTPKDRLEPARLLVECIESR